MAQVTIEWTTTQVYEYKRTFDLAEWPEEVIAEVAEGDFGSITSGLLPDSETVRNEVGGYCDDREVTEIWFEDAR